MKGFCLFRQGVLKLCNSMAMPSEVSMPALSKSLGGALLIMAISIMGVISPVFPQAASMPAPLTKDFAAELRPEDFSGALDIRIHPEDGKLEPPAELLLKDPKGRKIGRDPRRGQAYHGIPLAHYEFEGIDDAETGAPGPQTGIIEIRNPVPGKYTLEIIGKWTGFYSMAIRGYDRNLKDSTIVLKKAKITPGAIRTFSFTFSDEVGKSSLTPVSSGNNP